MSEVTNSVRFVLDGCIVEARGKRRTTTALDYLREELHRTGTKEGCAEGDCGACVVLVGELAADGQSVNYHPVNSCMQLLPSLDGKSVKTVESLKGADGRLHPVQQGMVECFGSQCGFCTPGIVMSLAGLVQNNPCPSRADINDALSGNLCRCTGYKPIVDAALGACKASPAELRLQDAADLPLLKEIARDADPTYSLDGQIVTQPVVRTRRGSEFVSPASVEELLQYLDHHPDATLVAGSTEIGLQVNKQFSRPTYIAYLGQIAQLKLLREDAQSWHIGAAVSLEAMLPMLQAQYADFGEVIRRFGSPPIRSTATLAGNIANGSPIGDSMPCLMALDAQLHLRSAKAARVVLLADFYTGMKQSVLAPGEFIESITLPKLKARERFRAHKISKRFDQDISATCAALRYELSGGVLKNVRVAYNGMAPSPCRARKLEALLEGKAPSAITAEAIDAVIAQSFPARDGLRASWAYRSLVARNLILQFAEGSLDIQEAA